MDGEKQKDGRGRHTKELWRNPIYRRRMIKALKGRMNFAGHRHSKESIERMSMIKYNGKEKRIDSRGYIWIFNPGHYRALNGRVKEEIMIAEHVLGRHLKKSEIVHHINGMKSDNRNKNLLICTGTYHRQLHARMSGFGTKHNRRNACHLPR